MEYDGEFRMSTPVRVAPPDAADFRFPQDVSFDGRILAVGSDKPTLGAEAGAHRVRVVLNWTQELARLAPREE